MKIHIFFLFYCITFVVISSDLESALCLKLKELLITRIETPNQPIVKVLLDVALLNPLLIQVLDELLPFHPVDERTDVTAISKEGSARQVERTSYWGDRQEKKIWGWTCVSWEKWWTIAKQTVQVVSRHVKNTISMVLILPSRCIGPLQPYSNSTCGNHKRAMATKLRSCH